MSKRRTPKDWDGENEKLQTFLYENELYDSAVQFSPYHFRITTKKATVDVWAGAKKFYIQGTGFSATYQNINELKKYLI